MINLRLALESGRHEQGDIPFPDVGLNPVFESISGYPIPVQRRRQSIALEAVNPFLLVAGVAVVFGMLGQLILWFLSDGNGSSSSGGGGGGGALARSEQKIEKVERRLNMVEAINEMNKLTKKDRHAAGVTAPPEPEAQAMFSIDDVNFANKRGAAWEFVDALGRIDKYFDTVKKLLSQTDEFMKVWGNAGPDLQLSDSMRNSLKAFPTNMQKLLHELDGIEGRKDLVTEIRNAKAKVHDERDTPAKLSEDGYMSAGLGMRMQGKYFLDDWKEKLPELQKQLEELGALADKHDNDHKEFKAKQTEANSAKDGPDAKDIATFVTEGRVQLNRVGNYARAVLVIVQMGIDRINRLDKLTAVMKADVIAFNKWYEANVEAGKLTLQQEVKDLVKKIKDADHTTVEI